MALSLAEHVRLHQQATADNISQAHFPASAASVGAPFALLLESVLQEHFAAVSAAGVADAQIQPAFRISQVDLSAVMRSSDHEAEACPCGHLVTAPGHSASHLHSVVGATQSLLLRLLQHFFLLTRPVLLELQASLPTRSDLSAAALLPLPSLAPFLCSAAWGSVQALSYPMASQPRAAPAYALKELEAVVARLESLGMEEDIDDAGVGNTVAETANQQQQQAGPATPRRSRQNEATLYDAGEAVACSSLARLSLGSFSQKHTAASHVNASAAAASHSGTAPSCKPAIEAAIETATETPLATAPLLWPAWFRQRMMQEWGAAEGLSLAVLQAQLLLLLPRHLRDVDEAASSKLSAHLLLPQPSRPAPPALPVAPRALAAFQKPPCFDGAQVWHTHAFQAVDKHG